jgi:hypothetical protein
MDKPKALSRGVYRIKSVYNVTGSLVVADNIGEAVVVWCTEMSSREGSITAVECCGRAIVQSTKVE